MTFFVLDANPVKSANRLCFLDAECAAYDGARIIVSAIEMNGGEVDDLPPGDINHPLVRWAVVSAENARWLHRYATAAHIMTKDSMPLEEYRDAFTRLNHIASVIDERLPAGRQETLFGNFYIDGDVAEALTYEQTIQSNRVFYEETRKHLSWADFDPTLYGGEEE